MAHHRQYYLFDLPTDLVTSLALRTLGFSTSDLALPDDSPPSSQSSRSSSPQPEPSASSCTICPGVLHADPAEKRAHFRSNWHRYNLKLKLFQEKPVSESEFAILLRQEASESRKGDVGQADGDASSDNSFEVVDRLLKKYQPSQQPPPTEIVPPPPPTIHRTAIAWFHSPSSTQLGVYRSVFNSTAEPQEYLDELRGMQRITRDGRLWVLLMTGGGHFAGMVAQVSPTQDGFSSKSSSNDRRERGNISYDILKHKTFHRYTTRRKQGGSQSSNDKAKGFAKSAGATLRRYGEQALRDDIRTLLKDWSQDIHKCERIWIGASASNQHIFWEYEGASIRKNDPRIRTFPFPTQRATQSELTRCLVELTHTKVTHMTDDMLRAQDDEFLSSLPSSREPGPAEVKKDALPSIPAQPSVQLSEEKHLQNAKWQRLLEIIRKGRLETLKQFWEREGEVLGGINALIPVWTGESSPTLLHVASASGQNQVVQWMLEEENADPTLSVGSFLSAKSSGIPDTEAKAVSDHRSKQVPYDVASTKEVRNVFRRYAAECPDKWDWFGAAHIPSVLHRDMEAEREGKRKERRKALKEKMRDKSAKGEPEVEPQARLAALSLQTPDSNPIVPGAGLSSEALAAIEREKRASAAEARIRAMRQNKS